MIEPLSTPTADRSPSSAETNADKDKAAPTSFYCSGCRRKVKTTTRWIGKPETCPYCGARTVVGQESEPSEPDPRRLASNTLLVGLLAIVLGFIGLFFRKYFTEAASFAAVALGVAAPILALRARVLLARRRAEFPSRTAEAQRAIIHAGFGTFFGLVGMAMGALAIVLAFVSMVP